MLEQEVCIELTEEELEQLNKERLPDDPYSMILFADEHNEVVLAGAEGVLKFQNPEDARHVFENIEELFHEIADRKADRGASAGRELL